MSWLLQDRAKGSTHSDTQLPLLQRCCSDSAARKQEENNFCFHTPFLLASFFDPEE
jgi:hypothetical protein